MQDYETEMKPRDLMEEINRVSSQSVLNESMTIEKGSEGTETPWKIHHEISPMKLRQLLSSGEELSI
jgi:hypothetical protein